MRQIEFSRTIVFDAQSAYYLLMAPLTAAVFDFVGRAGSNGRLDAGALAIVLLACLQVLALGSLGYEEYQIVGAASLPALAAIQERSATVSAAEPTGDRHCEGLPLQIVRFEEVCFSYPDGRPVFDRLDLTVPAGSSLAIVGASGAGKTTLIKLLARLYRAVLRAHPRGLCRPSGAGPDVRPPSRTSASAASHG